MIDPDLSLLLDPVHRDQSDRLAKLVAADRASECGLLSCEALLRYCALPSFTRPLLSTGSRVYGTPHENSDWDWVLLSTGSTTKDWLQKNYDYSGKNFPDLDNGRYPADMIESRMANSYRFGPVNVIRVANLRQWYIWKEGTDRLLKEAIVDGPRTRDRAVDIFTSVMNELPLLDPAERNHRLVSARWGIETASALPGVLVGDIEDFGHSTGTAE